MFGRMFMLLICNVNGDQGLSYPINKYIYKSIPYNNMP